MVVVLRTGFNAMAVETPPTVPVVARVRVVY
jgi:hypothetical protein